MSSLLEALHGTYPLKQAPLVLIHAVSGVTLTMMRIHVIAPGVKVLEKFVASTVCTSNTKGSVGMNDPYMANKITQALPSILSTTRTL